MPSDLALLTFDKVHLIMGYFPLFIFDFCMKRARLCVNNIVCLVRGNPGSQSAYPVLTRYLGLLKQQPKTSTGTAQSG